MPHRPRLWRAMPNRLTASSKNLSSDLLVDAGFTAQVGHRTVALDDVFDCCAQSGIANLFGADHSVAVEFQARHQLLDVGHVRHRDLGRARSCPDSSGCAAPKPAPACLLRCCRRFQPMPGYPQPWTSRSASFSSLPAHAIAASTSLARTRPSLSAVDQVQRPAVELDAARRATQRDPELLIQLIQCQQIAPLSSCT